MNIRDDLTIRAPTGKEDVCVRFRIDTTDEAFILHDIAEGGQQYTLSFYAKSEGAGSITAGNTAMTTSSSWQRYVVTFTADSANIPIYFTVAGTYYLYNTQLEIGCKDTDFALNPADTEEDVDNLTAVTDEQSASISMLGGEIALKVDSSDFETYQAEVDGELVLVGHRISSAESAITQNAEEIALRVTKDDVIGAINLTSEEAKISFAKITLEGATIADSFTATNLHVTGNSIFDGTLNGATGSFTGDIVAESLTAYGSVKILQAGADTPGIALNAPATTGVSSLEIGEGFGQIVAKKPLYVVDTVTIAVKLFASDISAASIDVTNNITASGCITGGSFYTDDMVTAGGVYSTGDVLADGDIAANGNLTGTKLYAGSIELTNSTPFIDFHFDNDPSGGDYTARIVETASGRLVIRDRLAIGYVNDDYKLSVASMVCNGWLRTTGSRGWLSEDYGGGWYMMDSEWIRAYNGVGIYTAGDIKCGTDLTVAGTASMQGSMTVTGDATVKGTLSFMDYSGTSRRPASSAMTDGKKVAYIASNVNTSGTYYLTVSGQYGTEGSTYTTKNFTATTSDVRLKANIIDTQVEALPLISQIPIREFDWAGTGVHQKIGFVADELELLDEGLAIGGGYDEEGNLNAKGVNEFYLLGYLTKGIQELRDGLLNGEGVLETHDAMIKYLLDENAALKKRVKELEQQAA